ncbi:hypothetical protein GWN42_19495 [candidate division KSB1 bacterium]|nr:hypothetical protein [candidate division KSB1 bacterium]NIR71240.1 hypothetical protein [candidate division KSB1 bacterium]NIU26828.1 hypothetical protein [candidate division KSB1 bacterium]NIU92344.1 hypothetical protein [candidate division KSB1 bacterium]NIV94910.1 hypothetical protein [candidate division KSB1 bacterium]
MREGKHYYVGQGVYKPKWRGDHFSIDVKFDKGKGMYRVTMGKNGYYYPEGLNILVR